METVIKRESLYRYIVWFVYAAAFVLMGVLCPIGDGGDSAIFLEPSIYAAPVYPMLIRLLMTIFGQGSAMYIALAIIQGMLACVASIYLWHMLDKYVLHRRLWSVLAVGVILAPYLMTPMLSRKHLLMSNTVMLEALTLPGYYVFMALIIGIICEEKYRRYLIGALITSYLLMITRPQFMLTVPILVIAVAVVCIKKRSYVKPVVVLLIGIAIIVASNLTDRCYNLYYNGVFTGPAQGAETIMTGFMYASDEHTAESIDDESLKTLYDRLYAQLKEERMLYEYAEGSLLSRAAYYEQCHDTIKFDRFEPIVGDMFGELATGDYTKLILIRDEVAAGLRREIMFANLGNWICNYCSLVVMGFVRSVAIESYGLNYFALAMYIIAIALLIHTCKKRGMCRDAVLAIVLLASVVMFVMATAAVTMCLSRYMIYNLPFFYIAVIILLQGYNHEDSNKNG